MRCYPGLAFCNPACPFCPPGIFGPPGSGGGSNNNNNDDNDDDDDNEEDDDPDHTIIYVTLSDELFPTAMADPAALSSMDSIIMSDASKLFGISTTTSSSKTTTTTTEKPPDPTPTADCMYWDTLLFYTFQVYNINNWAEEDDGKALRDEEEGCGAIAHWDWNGETDDTYAYVYFTLPFLIKAGCVERAIVSAGGPKLSCVDGGVGPPIKRRAVEARDDSKKQLSTPVFPPFSEEVLQQCLVFYEALNDDAGTRVVEEHDDYIPMTWGGSGDPITTAAARF